MKLKDNVTNKQLEHLGFAYSKEEGLYYSVEYFVYIEVCQKSNIIKISCFKNGDYKLPNILLKMFQLGYIEESEE